jgi:hypothetical protein
MRIFMALLYVLFTLNLQSTPVFEAPKRKFTLSSAYAERFFNSNEGLVAFPISIIEAYGALFDVATPSFTEHWWSRLITSLVELPISYWLSNALFVPFHEFGHARADSAFGLDYHYGSFGYNTNFGTFSNYWSLSAIRLITPPFFFPGDGKAYASAQGSPSIPQVLENYWGAQGASIIISASGLNNQSLLAKKLAQGVYTGHGHITQFTHYVGNKISPWAYSILDKKNSHLTSGGTSDIGSILAGYKSKNYTITHGDIELQSWLSMLSSTSISYLKGYVDYWLSGNTRVYALELWGIRMPDINSYITSQGLSLELVSGYRLNKYLFFDLAYEFIWKGTSAHQVTPSAHINLAWIFPVLHELWLESDLVLSKNVGGKLALSYIPFEPKNTDFWQRFSYFIDLNIYNGFNLYGERNITSLSRGKTSSLDIFGGVNFNY